jgi:hypothetical protein
MFFTIVCHIIKQDDYIGSLLTTFKASVIFWGSWGSSENWLQPKTKTTFSKLKKLCLSKSVKRSVIHFFISLQCRITMKHNKSRLQLSLGVLKKVLSKFTSSLVNKISKGVIYIISGMGVCNNPGAKKSVKLGKIGIKIQGHRHSYMCYYTTYCLKITNNIS